MTRANATESVGSGGLPHSGESKAVLVCPRCTHESPVGGDWLLVVEDERVCLYCPDCWSQLTTRPR